MYKVSKTVISRTKYKDLYGYLETFGRLACALRNAAVFRMRQHITASGKENLSGNEKLVRDEIQLTVKTKNTKQPKFLMSYCFMDKLMRVTHNPDFFNGLPMQTSQEVLKQVVRDFKSWAESCKKYKTDPSGFTGRPVMPGYKKHDSVVSYVITNQDCVIYKKNNSSWMKFPKTDITMPIGYMPDKGRLMQVEVKKVYDDFVVLCVFDVPDDSTATHCFLHECGIDFGVNNIIALVSSSLDCLLYKGGMLKAENQFYNKQLAYYRSVAAQGHDTREAVKLGLLTTKRMQQINKKHHYRIHDMLHKISSDVIRYCVSNSIGIIVMGVNKYWKQESNIGHVNNQNFVQMPVCTLRKMITYKAEQAGIIVREQEESYTSRADLIIGDDIPVCSKEKHTAYKFSGLRIKRGLYRSGNGMIVNADLNAAGNILRKNIPSVFNNVTDWTFMQKIKVRKFSDLCNKSTPVKGIEAW